MDILKSFRGLFFLSFLVIFGSFIFYNFAQGTYVLASYGILFSFVVYVFYSIYISTKKIKRENIELLTETIALFSVFLFPLLAYGFVLFESSIEGILLLILFSFMQILNFVRNWTYEVHHSKGFPIILHGLFFPLIVFTSQVIAPNFEQALFVIYFIVTSMLSITPYNFIQYQGGLFEEKVEEQQREDNITSDNKNNLQINDEDNTKNISENNNENSKNIEGENHSINENNNNGEREQDTNEDNLLLNSIPYLNKNTINSQNEQILELEYDDESIDEEDEKFFNSLEKLK